MHKSCATLRAFLSQSKPSALVEVLEVNGSTPRDAGTWMLVSKDQIFRTIGGGQLENMAIEKARSVITSNDDRAFEMNIPLGPSIGQCCGGTVDLRIRLLDEANENDLLKRFEEEGEEFPTVYIFGAGHVGKALAETLSRLPLHPVLIDSRPSELNLVTVDVEKRLSAMPEADVRSAKPDSAFIILTHDHALDFLITREALAREDALYVGMIGSKTKRATFRNWLTRENGNEAGIERLICPIGGSRLKDKRPEVIAALTAAEILSCLKN